MFKEKVNARTDGRTTDNGPWHKLAGLRPVELKTIEFIKDKTTESNFESTLFAKAAKKIDLNHGWQVQRRPSNHQVPSSITGSGYEL